MTDLTTAGPASFGRPAFSSLKPPKLGFGRAIVQTVEAFGYALNLAYVQPYRLGGNQTQILREGSEKGRDPGW